SDVFVENFTPRVMKRWGLDYPHMKAINPNIVLVSNTGYGYGGRFSAYPAQARTMEGTQGLAGVTGYRNGEPSRAGQSYVDFLAAWSCLMSVFLGLRHRRRFGRGLWADVGMYQLGCYNLGEYILDWTANGTPGERIGDRHRQFAPQGCYRCAGEDAWCALSVRNDEEWVSLCGVIGRPELARDERYATESARRANHDDIDDIIAQWTRNVSKIEAMERLQAVGVPAGAVLDGRDLHFDPQLKARGLLEIVNFPEEREMGANRPIIGRPWRFSKMPLCVRGPAPRFGQHNREVLCEILGYDESRYQAIEGAGIVVEKPLKASAEPFLSLDERVRLGALAYWDRDYKERLGIA
ncbi:MAG: CoA transferase, partial [Pseudomonadota bacterium]